MITEIIIERRATALQVSFLKWIVKNKFEKEVLTNNKKGPEIYYDWIDGNKYTITVNPGETVEKFQTISFHFDEIDNVYHKDILIKLFSIYWLGDRSHSRTIHTEIKERCFEKLLRSGKIRKATERYVYVFWKKDNPEFFENKQPYAVIRRIK